MKTLGERDDLRVVMDTKRGYGRLERIPSPETLARYYKSEFWQATKSGEQERREAQAEWYTAIYGDWLTLVEKHAPLEEHAARLIDVGCGFGWFLKTATERGWRAMGIEPNVQARKYAVDKLGQTVLGGSWEACAVGEAVCISALWVLEHLPEPEAFLRWAHTHLVMGGVLLLAVPNDFNAYQMSLSKMGSVTVPYWWIDRTHLNYWSWPTLANLLGRHGFRLVEQQTMYPMEQFLVEGNDYTADPELGARLHERVRAGDMQMMRERRLTFYGNWAQAGTGRELVAVAVKE